MRDLLDKIKLLEDQAAEEKLKKFKARKEAEEKADTEAKAKVKPADSVKKDKDNTSVVAPVTGAAPVEPDKKDTKYKDNAGNIPTVNGPITSSSGNWVNWGPQSDNPGFDLWVNDVTNQQMFRKKKYF
jgi:hypothetical protein